MFGAKTKTTKMPVQGGDNGEASIEGDETLYNAEENADTAQNSGIIAEIADAHSDTAPQVTPEAIAAENARLQEENGTSSPGYDPNSDEWERDERGNVLFKKDGKTPKRKRGRKIGQAGTGDNTQEVGDDIPSGQGVNPYLATGEVTVTLSTSAMMFLLGPEWETVPEEHKAMVQAWATYYQQTGIKEPPPWLMLVAVNMLYARSRINKPITVSRFVAMKIWIGTKLAKLKERKNVQA